jgi:hypothetical protein
MRQILWILAIFLNINLLQAQQAETILIGEVLNKAGSERMLTQRMAKLYIALYLGTDIKESKAELDATVSLFDNRLVELKSIKINARYTKRIERVNHLWKSYKELIISRPTKENILLLLKENNIILESCELLTNELEWYASRFSSENGLYQMNENVMQLENRAGRQRMLTERVLFYFLVNHALIGADSKFDKELNLALEDYQINLTELMGATENTPEIDYRLILLSKEWEALSVSCHQKEKDFSNIASVLKMGENLLKSMEEITKSYEVLIDLRVASLLLNNAIDLAEQQNILTQKITKTYILEGLTENSKYNKERKIDVSIFEQNMDELKLFAPMEEITQALDVVDNLWTNYRNEVMNPSTKAGAKELLYANSELLMASKNVTTLLEMYAKMYKKSVTSYNYVMVDWIKQIGHQEMLTERILMYSYALSWGIKKDAIPKELDRAGREYLENFNALSLSIPIPNIQERGERLAEKWEVVKTYLSDLERYQEELNEWSGDLSKELGDLTKSYRKKIKGMVAEEAVEKASEQCMLSQKMASNYLAIGMGLNEQYQQQQLEKDKLLFQKQLEEIKLFAQTTELKAALANVNDLWERYQTVFRKKLLKEDVVFLLDISQEMLTACELVLKEINTVSNTDQITKINTAADLRTKTEQIFLFCLAERWSEKKYKKELSTVFLDYEKGLKFFQGNIDNTPKMSTILDSIERYYKRLKSYEEGLEEVDIYALFMVRNVLLLETEKLTKSSTKVTLF